MFPVARGRFCAKPLRRTGLTTARSTPSNGTASLQLMNCLGRLGYPRLHAARGWLGWLPRGGLHDSGRSTLSRAHGGSGLFAATIAMVLPCTVPGAMARRPALSRTCRLLSDKRRLRLIPFFLRRDAGMGRDQVTITARGRHIGPPVCAVRRGRRKLAWSSCTEDQAALLLGHCDLRSQRFIDRKARK